MIRTGIKVVKDPDGVIRHGYHLLRQKFAGTREEDRKKDAHWANADLSYKLRSVQKVMREKFRKSKSLKYVSNCSRRLGKSFLLCVVGVEAALRKKNQIIRIGAPTQKAMRSILRPILRDIFEDAPPPLRPSFNSIDGLYRFAHNGYEIQVAGCNNGHAEDMRGSKAHLILLDEAAQIDDLKYVVSDILMPQLLDTDGRLGMYSTPPRTPDHPFTEFVAAAKLEGCYSEHNIYEAGYDPETVERFKAEAGGEDSTTWKREYMCQFVVDETYAIIPEWKDSMVGEVQRPDEFRYLHRYVSMDLGVRDYHVNLFFYYDFKNARIVFEDEWAIKGPSMTTKLIAESVRLKEKLLWNDLPVYRRVSDNDNPLMLQDLYKLHGLAFEPTDKDNLEAMVNHLRLLVAAGRVVVSPKCQHLIGCMKFGIWKENRKEFDRSEAFGHYDALAAAIYGVRNIDFSNNPIPPTLGMSPETHFIGDLNGRRQVDRVVLELFGKKPKPY